jgi:hypothetical protein
LARLQNDQKTNEEIMSKKKKMKEDFKKNYHVEKEILKAVRKRIESELVFLLLDTTTTTTTTNDKKDS